jgi:hypothetical protein
MEDLADQLEAERVIGDELPSLRKEQTRLARLLSEDKKARGDLVVVGGEERAKRLESINGALVAKQAEDDGLKRREKSLSDLVAVIRSWSWVTGWPDFKGWRGSSPTRNGSARTLADFSVAGVLVHDHASRLLRTRAGSVDPVDLTERRGLARLEDGAAAWRSVHLHVRQLRTTTPTLTGLRATSWPYAPTKGTIFCGCVPARDGGAGGSATPSSTRYFFTVRPHTRPHGRSRHRTRLPRAARGNDGRSSRTPHPGS